MTQQFDELMKELKAQRETIACLRAKFNAPMQFAEMQKMATMRAAKLRKNDKKLSSDVDIQLL